MRVRAKMSPHQKKISNLRRGRQALSLYFISFAMNLKVYSFAIHQGRVAEWLGRGLQNLLQRFKSARDLKKSLAKVRLFSFTYTVLYLRLINSSKKATFLRKKLVVKKYEYSSFL